MLPWLCDEAGAVLPGLVGRTLPLRYAVREGNCRMTSNGQGRPLLVRLQGKELGVEIVDLAKDP